MYYLCGSIILNLIFMKYNCPVPKPEWNIKPEQVKELDKAFALMNRCAEKRIGLNMNNLKEVENYQFEAEFAFNRASDARARINLVNYTDPIDKELDRFRREDYMPVEVLMEQSSDMQEIS